MVLMTIPQMNQKLQQLSHFFSSRSAAFTAKIQMHEGRFRQQDYQQFDNLLEQIKRDAMLKITNFFNERFQIRSSIYDHEIGSYMQDGNGVKVDLKKFRQNLIQTSLQTKQQQHRKQLLMEYFSQKFRKNMILKKCIQKWKEYELQCKLQKAQNKRMDQIYKNNLLKKSFFPWRTLTYKQGYQNTVKREAMKDINNIQQQYQGIIQILKQKVYQTDEIIKVKKAAKGKNLLKSISNLSLEVMNLNQMSLRDGQWSQQTTHKFMREVDSVIKQKINKVREYRKGLIQGDIVQDNQLQKKKKHISFA